MQLINFIGGLGMSLISGIVNSVEDGTVKTGHFAGSAFKTVILTTGNRLTCFDISFIADLEQGKEYTFLGFLLFFHCIFFRLWFVLH